jgi:ABC-2 type transport system ATP-binding protein
MNPAIRTEGLTKYYGRVIGVEDLSFDVGEGEVFGFLGANGAGKTTTIRLLLDLIRATSGRASVCGFDSRRDTLRARAQIGYLPGEMPIYPELTGAGFLSFLARLSEHAIPQTRIDGLLRRFDVSNLDLRRPMRDYSHGMRRKLGLVQALMADAPVLILDEPTAGLDPLMVEAFCETIGEIARNGATTVFLSSHVMSEVDRLCSRVAVIRAGRLVTVRSVPELRATAPRRVTIRFSRPVDAAVPPEVTAISRDACEWVLETYGPIGAIVTAISTLPVADISIAPFSLESVVVDLLKEAQAC